MTEDQTNERIADDVEGQRLASTAERVVSRNPDEDDDVEGHKLMGTP